MSIFGNALRALLLLTLLLGLSSTVQAQESQNAGLPDAIVLPPSDATHPVISGLETREIDGMRAHFDPEHLPVVQPLLDILPETRSRIVADLSPGSLASVDIYFLRTIEDYFTAQGEVPRTPAWASGLALLGRDVILIRLDPVGGGRLELDRTLAHEMSHIALSHHAKMRRLPHWFVEGFAVIQTEEWNMKRAGPLAEAAVAGGLLDFKDIDARFPANAATANIAYSQSAHFLRWTIQRHGRPEFRDWMREVGNGQDVYVAYETAYGESFSTAEAAWRESLEVEDGWMMFFLAGTTMFFAMAVLFLFVWLWVRRRSKQRFARLEDPGDGYLPAHLQGFGPFAGPVKPTEERPVSGVPDNVTLH